MREEGGRGRERGGREGRGGKKKGGGGEKDKEKRGEERRTKRISKGS